MALQVNLDELLQLGGPDAPDVRTLVIDAAARSLLTTYLIDEEGGPHRALSSLAHEIHEQIRQEIREQARLEAAGLVRKLLAREVQLTDGMGYGRGTKRVEDLIVEELRNAVHHGGTGRRGESVLTEIIRDIVRGELRGEFEKVLAEAREPLVEALREEANGVFTRAARRLTL